MLVLCDFGDSYFDMVCVKKPLDFSCLALRHTIITIIAMQRYNKKPIYTHLLQEYFLNPPEFKNY